MKKKLKKICGNCVTGDSLVITDNTVKRLSDVLPNEKTLFNNSYHPITSFKYNGKKPTIKITTNLGLELKLTKDHLVGTPNGWTQADKLNINQEILTIQEELNNTSDHIDYYGSLLLGALTGDGWINRIKRKDGTRLNGLGFGFTVDKYEAWQPMLEYGGNLFDSKEKPCLMKSVKKPLVQGYFVETKKPFLRIQWRNKQAEKFGELLDKQHVPQVIWQSSQKIWGAYLCGLFSTDGNLSINYNTNTTQIRINFYQTSESLIREVQMMLRLMGIYTRPIRVIRRPPYKNLFELTISRINSVAIFQNKISFIDNPRKLELEKNIKKAVSLPINTRYSVRRKVNSIERVKKIEDGGEKDVYDISVPGTNCFYANGILVHNCLLYNKNQGQCKVAILINGEQIHMPVSPNDRCHMDELGIPVEQVRWWVEDPATGKPTTGSGVVKIEYPKDFFGEDKR